MIELINLCKTYKINKETTFSLENINFKIENNSLNFILGKSGCGKTTLLNLLGSIDRPDSGNIILDCKDITTFNEKQLTKYRNQYIGYIFQDFNLIPDLSVKENIDLSFRLQKRKISNEQLGRLLKKVDLIGFENRKIKDLSGGQKQRVAIARAIAKEPKLLLCDEPTGALDSKTSKEIFKLLKDISKECIVIVVSHDDESAKEYGDRIITLNDGRILTDKIEKSIDAGLNYNLIETENFKHKMEFGFISKFAYKNFKKRPIRLAIALIILSLSSLSVAFSSAIKGINKNEAVFNAMKENDVNYLVYKKQNIKVVNNENEYWTGYFSKSDIKEIQDSALYNEKIDLVYRSLDLCNSNFNKYKAEISNYYFSSLSGTCEIDKDFVENYSLKLISGSLPENDNEVVISKYFFGYFQNFGYKNGDEIIENPTYEDMLGKQICIQSSENKIKLNFNISGIIDTKFREDKFNPSNVKSSNYELQNAYAESITYGLHNLIFVNSGFYSRNFVSNYENSVPSFKGRQFEITNLDSISYEKYDLVKKADDGVDFVDCVNASSDEAPLVYLPAAFFVDDVDESLDQIIFNYAYEEFDNNRDKFDESWLSGFDYYEYIISNGYEDNKYNKVNISFFKEILANEIYNNFKDVLTRKSIQFVNNCADGFPNFKVKIGGVHFEELDELVANSICYDKIIESFGDSLSNCSSIILRQTASSKTNISNYQKNAEIKLEATREYEYGRIETGNEYFTSFEFVEGVLGTFQQLFQILNVGLTLFAILFTYFYFSGVVIDKTKEIGILRCLGTRKSDIAKIFVLQNIFVCLFAVLIASGLCAGGIGIANSLFAKTVSVEMNFINTKLIYFLEISGITLIGSFIGIAIPLLKAFLKKPVQTLKAND